MGAILWGKLPAHGDFVSRGLSAPARDELDERLRGFAEGADDYVVKPFAMAELVARVTAVLRRRGRIPSVIEVSDLVLDPEAATVRRGGVLLDLSATEFRLLRFLAESRGRTRPDENR